jgi:hypothetical protein
VPLRTLCTQQPAHRSSSSQEFFMQPTQTQSTPDKGRRILARQLARELTKEELAEAAGGMRPNSSSSWSSSGSGEGDDGGADD